MSLISKIILFLISCVVLGLVLFFGMNKAYSAINPSSPEIGEIGKPYIKFNGDIVQVALDEKDLRRDTGDKILLYKLVPKLEHPKFSGNRERWFKLCIVKTERGYRYYPLGHVPKGRVPMYHPAINTIVFDPNFGEETLVAIFKEGVDNRLKNEWVRQAIQFLRGYRENLKQRRGIK